MLLVMEKDGNGQSSRLGSLLLVMYVYWLEFSLKHFLFVLVMNITITDHYVKNACISILFCTTTNIKTKIFEHGCLNSHTHKLVHYCQ